MRASDDLDRFEVKAKGVNDYVSEVDLAAEPPTFWHSDWILPYDPSLR